VTEALKAGRRELEAVYLRQGKAETRVSALLHWAALRRVPVRYVDEPQLKALAGDVHHQGVCARARALPLADLTRVVPADPLRGALPLLVLLVNIQDPHNFGAIVRTAHCAGVDAVVIPRKRSVPPLPSVSRISAGALEHLPIVLVTNLVATIRLLKTKGIWVVGLDGSAAQSVFDAALDRPLALVVGGEEKGLRPLVRDNCDFRVAIPHAKEFDSLNASVAAAVVIFEAYRQRIQKSSKAAQNQNHVSENGGR